MTRGRRFGLLGGSFVAVGISLLGLSVAMGDSLGIFGAVRGGDPVYECYADGNYPSCSNAVMDQLGSQPGGEGYAQCGNQAGYPGAGGRTWSYCPSAPCTVHTNKQCLLGQCIDKVVMQCEGPLLAECQDIMGGAPCGQAERGRCSSSRSCTDCEDPPGGQDCVCTWGDCAPAGLGDGACAPPGCGVQ